MNKYLVTYTTNEDDSCTVWTHADSCNEAKNNILHEYHDVNEVIHIKKMD